ncbi:NAD(P)/FAD-dependent oxidoreductase [Pseudahrensia aquimaris]|uniref:NAD(P)/FAD-dependent oxidoreductase n=1 Tax=Pseudahrensia aquimaris TaxID=744461 RepID=A0ABW3FDN9_9HYPH
MKVTRQPFDPGPAAWLEILPAASAPTPLEGKQTADVVVIGAGFAGLTAARRLNQLEPKAKIIVLEARRVAEGPAGRNSGFMIDLPHNLASKDYAGVSDTDAAQTAMNREAIAYAAQAAEELAMSDEAFTISGKINAAATEKGDKHNRDYAIHLSKLTEAHEMLDAAQMRAISGSSYYRSGLFTPGTAMLQPALYVRHLARGLVESGVMLCENSPVIEMRKSNQNWQIITPKGSLIAPRVVLATNGHAESFGHFQRRLMHIYLYASMTEALSPESIAKLGGSERWGFTPADPLGTTVRKISGTGGTRIVVRNRFTWSPKRTVSPDKLNAIAPAHDRSFTERFPNLKDVKMEYRWGGLLCLSWNTVPAFGEIDDGLFSACCQNGLGTAMGTLSGKLIAEMMMGKSSNSLRAMLAYPKPKRLPPEPFASLGAEATLRWGEFRAGREM